MPARPRSSTRTEPSASSSKPTREPFKEWLGERAVLEIADAIVAVHPAFDRAGFTRVLKRELPALELMDRSLRIARELRARLPEDYLVALGVLLEALPADDGVHFKEGQFTWLPFLRFVGLFGLPHPERSLEALARMTTRFSAEFDVRPFLISEFRRAMSFVERWAHSTDPRVRRLASEGSRPRLPWGVRLQALIEDPTPTLRVLELLKDDPDPVVRRSIANHLNDVAKDHPARVIEVARRWSKNTGEERRALIRHALRSLVKAGHPEALSLVGADVAAQIELRKLRVATPEVVLGGALEFSFELVNRELSAVSVVVDYAVHHQKADGGTTPKVFKLSKRMLAPGETLKLEKRHPMKPITTRRYYPGRHEVEILVNGRAAGRKPFRLEVPER